MFNFATSAAAPKLNTRPGNPPDGALAELLSFTLDDGTPASHARRRLCWDYTSTHGSDTCLVLLNGTELHCHSAILSHASPLLHALLFDEEGGLRKRVAIDNVFPRIAQAGLPYALDHVSF